MSTSHMTQALTAIKAALQAWDDRADEPALRLSQVAIVDHPLPWDSYPAAMVSPDSITDRNGESTSTVNVSIFAEFVLEEEAVTGLEDLAEECKHYLGAKLRLGELGDGIFEGNIKTTQRGRGEVGLESAGYSPVRWITLEIQPQWLDSEDY